ncbi:MAG: HD domain-containing protein [Helicobacteraceae bacterium]|jgi:[protein-PII] uridylyltransferase|nr:HD domain-containing protein [Helicobacteraceae bacterium]
MRADFAKKLERLIEEEADDFSVSKLFKEERTEYYASLAQRFGGAAPRQFLIQHARMIEEFIAAFYRYVLRGTFGNYVPPLSALPIAFFALGSFGREQCAPYSDIDLMIVYKDAKGYNVQPIIERVLYLAWDAGFQLGHRVHEIGELKETAAQENTIKTAMLEGRFFCGSRILNVEVENALNGIRFDRRDEFIEAKMREYRERRAKKPITMEPDIKEGVGGLRDANALFWIARLLFGVSSTKDIVGAFIREEDYRVFHQALETLFRVRSALHIIAGRKVDTLLFQYQREAALFMGFADTKRRKAERFLLKRVLQALKIIDRHSAYYLAKLTRRQPPLGVVCAPFESENEEMGVLLRKALDAPMNAPFDITFVMALKRAKVSKRSKASFKETIRELFHRSDSHLLISALDSAEVLDVLFPPLKGVVSLAQFDGYHKRPVDEHSILTLKTLNSLSGEAGRLFDGLSAEDRMLLRLVALMHDAGKGGSHNRHSEAGARRFGSFARALGLRSDQVERGVLLIKLHTLMAHVARKEDIYSDRVVFAFASAIASVTALTMLYILTICDISSVAENTLTPLMIGLLRDLYARSIEALEKREQISEAAARTRKERLLMAYDRFAALDAHEKRQILSIDSALFFLKFKPAEILEFSAKARATELVSFDVSLEPSFTLDVISKTPFNLGWFLGKLARFDLGAMDIFKLFDGAKLFRMQFRRRFDESTALLSDLVEKSLDMSRTMEYKRPSIKKKEIEIDFDHSPTYARMSLQTADQQGLMAFFIDLFDRRGVDIATAKIDTIRHRTNNMFLIEKNSGFVKEDIVGELTRVTRSGV